MSETKYVVVKTHNFDAETEAVEFTDYNKAVAYLHWFWEDYYNEEIAACSSLDIKRTFHEAEYAIVRWVDGDYTEFNLIEVYPPREDFPDDWEKYAM